jgi:hypothetical protein
MDMKVRMAASVDLVCLPTQVPIYLFQSGRSLWQAMLAVVETAFMSLRVRLAVSIYLVALSTPWPMHSFRSGRSLWPAQLCSRRNSLHEP